MQSQASVVIEKSIEEVFEYTLNHVPEWSIIVVEDEVLEDVGGGGVGTSFRCVTEERGRRMEFAGLVTKHEPPTLSAIHLTGKSFDIEAEYIFEDLGGRTRVTQNSEVQGKGFVKVMFLLFGWMMKKSGCKAAEDELNNLKRLLEERQTAPTA